MGERDDGPSKVKDNELIIPVNPTEIYWIQIVRGFNSVRFNLQQRRDLLFSKFPFQDLFKDKEFI